MNVADGVTGASGIRIAQDEQGIATLTLDRAAARNALDKTMVEHLLSALADLAANEQTRGLVLRGQGRHFCAGIDLEWMLGGLSQPIEAMEHDSRLIQSVYRAIYEFPLPTVAVIQGAAIAGGLGLACACDAVVAHKDAIFSAPEVRIGLVPGMLMPLLTLRLGAGHARQIGALGLTYDAPQMQTMGLVTRIAGDDEELAAACKEMTAAMLAASPQAIRLFKETMNHAELPGREEFFSASLQAVVESRLSQAGRSGVAAASQRQAPPWAVSARPGH